MGNDDINDIASAIDAAAASFGPNRGMFYTTALNLTTPFTVRINRHFGMAESALPKPWAAFKAANTRYAAIESKVKARLGFDGSTSRTLYGSWEDEIHYSDPEAHLEKFMDVPRSQISEYETQIVHYVTYIQSSRKAAMNRAKSGWSPRGIAIDYDYHFYTVGVDNPITFDGRGAVVPQERPVTYTWNFGMDAEPVTHGVAMPTCIYTTPGIKTVTLTCTATDDPQITWSGNMSAIAFQGTLSVDTNQLVLPDDSATGTRGGGGTSGKSGARGSDGASNEGTTKSTTPPIIDPPPGTIPPIVTPPTVNLPPSTVTITCDVLPAGFTPTSVAAEVHNGDALDATTLVKQIALARTSLTGNSYTGSWDGTDENGAPVDAGEFQIVGIINHLANGIRQTYTTPPANVTASDGSIQVRIDPSSDSYLSARQELPDRNPNDNLPPPRTTPAEIRYEIDPPTGIPSNGATIEISKDTRIVKTAVLPPPTLGLQSYFWDGTDDDGDFVADDTASGYGVYNVVIKVTHAPGNSNIEPYENDPPHPITVFGVEYNFVTSGNAVIAPANVTFTADVMGRAANLREAGGEDLIRCLADIKPDTLDATYNPMINWEIEDDPDVAGDSGNPPDVQADPQATPPTGGANGIVRVVASVIPEEDVDARANRARMTIPGRHYHLNYRIQANFVLRDGIKTYPTVSQWKAIRQDDRDYLRQLYMDMDTQTNTRHIRRPPRNTQTAHGRGDRVN